MAYDSVRAQLDKLLGADRNGPTPASRRHPVPYTDASVCKHYLLAFCPHDLSIKHRSEPGSCARRHDPAARAAFDAARRADPRLPAVARWTRELLADCRAVLADEERKIRGHARRLQETYNATGDLAGLMIKSFDTLKALGMVTPEAKIRVLSEMDDDYPALASDALSPEDPQPQAADVGNAKKETGSQLNVQNTSAPAPGKSSDTGSSAEEQDAADGDDDDDDDLADFGVIKVIPASTGTSKEEPADKVAEKPADAATSSEAKEKTDGKVEPASDAIAPTDVKRHDSNVPSAEEKAQVDGNKETPADVAAQSANENKEEGEVQSDTAGMSAGAGTENTEGSAPKPIDKMEEFYQRGIGPDGLLMLDRKQSLRVCACCGGYISLVDAESRLLSHYGGKSHHSLVLLREKVAELEQAVASEKRAAEDFPSREHGRFRRDDRGYGWPRRDDRDYGRPRRDDRGRRNWGGYERDGDRNARDGDGRGRASGGWRNSSYRGRYDGEHVSGEDDYHRRDRDRYSGRYDSRKRHRSRSPTRSGRRQRYRR